MTSSELSFNTPVLVVGGGPTGLMVAGELKRRGLDCRVVEKATERSDLSRALAVHARTLEHLQCVGLVDQFLAEGERVDSISIYADGKQIVCLSLDELDSPYPYTLALEQNKTERILEGNLEKHGGKLERGVELSSIVQNGAGATCVLNKADGSTETIKAQWVVACDGAHSTVRTILGIPYEGWHEEDHFALADVKIDWPKQKANAVTMFSRGGKVAGLLPMTGGYFRLLCIADGGDKGAFADSKVPTMEELQRYLDSACHEKINISEPKWQTIFHVRYRKVPQYRLGHVFLAGDAAHCHSPAGGQGMNTGIQDALNLAWKLELVLKGVAKPELLDTYDEERNAVATVLLKNVDFLTRVNIMRNPIQRHLRNLLAPILVGSEVVQQRMRSFISELAINYKKSSLSHEYRRSLVAAVSRHDKENPGLGDWMEFGSGPDAGERAPDAQIFVGNGGERKATTLFDALAGTKHTLLLLTGESPTADVYRTLAHIGGDIAKMHGEHIAVHTVIAGDTIPDFASDMGSVFFDDDRSLHHRYGAGSECLYLIRPDGYVGFRSQPAVMVELTNYLKRIFS